MKDLVLTIDTVVRSDAISTITIVEKELIKLIVEKERVKLIKEINKRLWYSNQTK